MPDMTTEQISTDAGRWIVVSLPKHVISAKDNGNLVKGITAFATGRQGHLLPWVRMLLSIRDAALRNTAAVFIWTSLGIRLLCPSPCSGREAVRITQEIRTQNLMAAFI